MTQDTSTYYVWVGGSCDYGLGERGMRYSVLWRKQSRIIMMLAETLHIDAERALNLFYTTKVYQQLSDPKYGLQLMSDDYILENLIEELRETQ